MDDPRILTLCIWRQVSTQEADLLSSESDFSWDDESGKEADEGPKHLDNLAEDDKGEGDGGRQNGSSAKATHDDDDVSGQEADDERGDEVPKNATSGPLEGSGPGSREISTSTSLRVHVDRVHLVKKSTDNNASGKRNHKCEICKKRFSRVCDLRRHVDAVHLRKEVASFKVCDKGFTSLWTAHGHCPSWKKDWILRHLWKGILLKVQSQEPHQCCPPWEDCEVQCMRHLQEAAFEQASPQEARRCRSPPEEAGSLRHL